MIRTCNTCSFLFAFHKNSFSGSYCSEDCYRIRFGFSRCLWCSNLFDKKSIEDLFCSEKCCADYAKSLVFKSIVDGRSICNSCRRGFIPKLSNNKFCSTDCYDGRSESTHSSPKVCKGCSKAFFSRNRKIKYCSSSCPGLRKGKGRLPEMKCHGAKCDVTFHPTGVNRKYCSVKCGRINKGFGPKRTLKDLVVMK